MEEDRKKLVDFGEHEEGKPDYTEEVGSRPLTLAGQYVWSGYCDVEVIRQDGTGTNFISDMEVSFVAPSEMAARLRTVYEMMNALTIEGVPVMMVQFKKVEKKYKLPEEELKLD